MRAKNLKVKCVGCEKDFDVSPENFSNYEVVFCPVCGLDHQILKRTSCVMVKALNCKSSDLELPQFL